MKLRVGDKAPTFVLSDQSGNEHILEKYKGKWILLYFYPKDDTPGCTKEACAIRDSYDVFTNKGVIVFGVSADSVQSHQQFADKYGLPFILLSDESKKVVELYGVWAQKKFMGREFMGILRTSFLINPEGKIVKIYENVKPDEHAKEVVSDLA